jgi:catechol 2,3-dioxygenase-like lactoylglutathione lyase family enzyme
MTMIHGFHAILYSTDAETDRAFFRDVLKFPYVDANDGWLIFRLPPAELGIHPSDGDQHGELYLMCDDVYQAVATLRAQGVPCTEPEDQGYGILTTMTLPGGGTLGMYQPRHLKAID